MTKRARASLELDLNMSPRQVAAALASMRFTAAHGWARTVRMDEAVRDLLVEAIDPTWKGQHPAAQALNAEEASRTAAHDEQKGDQG